MGGGGPSIIISALLDARTYVHSRAPYLWRLEGAGRACTAPQPSGPTSSFAVPQPGIYRGEQIVGEAFSLLS